MSWPAPDPHQLSRPPAGYYSTADGLRYWTGDNWGSRYWAWWRVVLTVVLCGVGGLALLAAMGAMLSDPGPDGDTAEFERVKSLGTLAFVIVPVVFGGLLALVHLGRLRANRAQSTALRGADPGQDT